MKIHYYLDDIVEICNMQHLTVEEIYSRLLKLDKNISKSSVYRNVEELAKAWKLKKICWVGKKSYFEKNIWDHIHLVDENLWTIVDLDISKLVLPELPKNFKMNNLDVKVYWSFS